MTTPWIYVDDELPEDAYLALVCVQNRAGQTWIATAYWNCDNARWYWDNDDPVADLWEIYAWREFPDDPAPYKKEAK